MSLAIVHTRANRGVDAPLVTVEAHLSGGLPGFSIVGLPETAVKESKDRVRSAIINSNFEFPPRRYTINLAPADLPKQGSRFDLAIAMGILAATDQVNAGKLAEFELIGELALSGELRPCDAILPVALACKRAGKKLILPQGNQHEAALVQGLEAYTAQSLGDVAGYINGEIAINPVTPNLQGGFIENDLDLSDVKGHQQAKRALTIAAAGGHSVLMCGPPGTGKTMLANRFVSLLPALSEEDAIEVAAIKSIAKQNIDINQWRTPSLRSPHHTLSAVSLAGGGNPPRPGEISLAHKGVLFLDELPEYSTRALEVLRQPLESGHVNISRASQQVTFPAQFQLIAAMNPCPCGYLGDPVKGCGYTCDKSERYQSRISGPILDRIDIHLALHTPKQEELLSPHTEPQLSSKEIRGKVIEARDRMYERQGCLNSALTSKQIDQVCKLDNDVEQFVFQASNKLQLSMRGLHRMMKVARSIADWEGATQVGMLHITEALQYRS